MDAKVTFDILGYRDWAKDLAEFVYVPYPYRKPHYHEDIKSVCDDAKAVFLVGWSEMVPLSFYKDRLVLVLHPSALPDYRGGSPLQHQIMDGLKETKITLFQLDEAYSAIDSGPIYATENLSLAGNLSDILRNLSVIGAQLISRAINDIEETVYSQGPFSVTEQSPGGFVRKRRTPEQSEITWTALGTHTAEYFYNKIRALQDPYPNAFIVCGDGKRLYLTGAHLDE